MRLIYGVVFGLMFGAMIAFITDTPLLWPTLAGGLVGLAGGAIAQKYPAPP